MTHIFANLLVLAWIAGLVWLFWVLPWWALFAAAGGVLLFNAIVIGAFRGGP